MNNLPLAPYQPADRYELTFEVIQKYNLEGHNIGFFRITKEEAERVFTTDGVVPAGTAVKIAIPGSRNGVTYIEGDLEICAADDEDFYGMTYSKVIPIGNDFPYRKKQFQSTVFHGDQVAVTTGQYVAIFRNQFDVGADNTAIEAAVGTKLYIGTGGKISAANRNGVPAVPTGVSVGRMMGTDTLPVKYSDNSQIQAGAVHKEIVVHMGMN